MKYLSRICSVLLVLATFQSCKDKDDTDVTPTPSTYNMIVGTWQLTYSADDDNKNGTMDEDEKFFPEPGEQSVVTFGADGYGKSMVTISGTLEDSTTFKWYLTDNDKNLTLITEGDTVAMQIVSASSKDLVLLEEGIDFDYKSWIVLAKQ